MKNIYLLIAICFFNTNIHSQWTQKGADIDGEAEYDASGLAVSMSSDGNTLAIGAWSNDGTGNNAGHVRVYNWSGTAWTQIGSDIDGEAADDRSGCSVSMSSDGNTLAIGASQNDGAGSDAGHVRVYEWSGTAWTQKGADIDGEAADDVSGRSISMSSDGNTLAIGAFWNDGTGTDAGHVRVYNWSGTAWVQKGVDIDGEAADDESGRSVSMSSDGNTLAIGAIQNDGTGNNAGHVRVYNWSGTAWTQKGAGIDGEAAMDGSGVAVSMSFDGNTLAIGATLNGGITNYQRGHVRVYEWSGTAWTQKGVDIDGEADGDFSGISVSMSSDGNTLAIGAHSNDGTGSDAGHVRVYNWSGTAWTQIGSDIDGEAADDRSGCSVSMSSDGNILAIGAMGNDGNGTSAGHVRVYSMDNVSILENTFNISPHPNPTNDLINLDINGYNGSVQTQVYDLSGRLLNSTNSTIISLKDYAKGIYVFRVAYGDIVELLKVIKD